MPKQHFTREEEAFLGYVRNMPPSIGKRFLLTLVDRGGFDAFESIWERLREAHISGYAKSLIRLTDEEIYCLAKARYCTSRRSFLTKAAAAGLCGLSFETARRGTGYLFNTLEGLASDESRVEETAFNGLASATCFSVSVGSGLAGGALLMKRSDLPTRQMVHNIIYSENLEEMNELMDSLNRMIAPIEVSLDETRPGIYR